MTDVVTFKLSTMYPSTHAHTHTHTHAQEWCQKKACKLGNMFKSHHIYIDNLVLHYQSKVLYIGTMDTHLQYIIFIILPRGMVLTNQHPSGSSTLNAAEPDSN